MTLAQLIQSSCTKSSFGAGGRTAGKYSTSSTFSALMDREDMCEPKDVQMTSLLTRNSNGTTLSRLSRWLTI